MDVTNKTRKPLSLPLPGGKKLFLGPGKTGQVSQKALTHPGLVKLLEAGDIKTSEDETKPKGGVGGDTGILPGGSRHAGSGAMRQSGDR